MARWVFAKKEDVPEDIRDGAKEIADGEDKGKFEVSVVLKSKLDTFRDNNTELSKKLAEAEPLITRFKSLHGVEGDLDFDKLETALTGLKETAQKVADGKLQGSEAIEAEVNKRTERMRVKHDEELRGSTTKAGEAVKQRDEALRSLDKMHIDRALISEVNDPDMGVNPWALRFLVQDAYGLFEVDRESKALVPKRNGTIVYGDSGADPMTVKEWLENEVRKNQPEFFKGSKGGGAEGGGDKRYGGLTQEAYDKLTAKEKLALANRGTAAQLKR